MGSYIVNMGIKRLGSLVNRNSRRLFLKLSNNIAKIKEIVYSRSRN